MEKKSTKVDFSPISCKKAPFHTGSKYYIGPLHNKKPLSQKTVICDHYEPKNYGKY